VRWDNDVAITDVPLSMCTTPPMTPSLEIVILSNFILGYASHVSAEPIQ
jgi:hypothetical protein